MLIQRNARRKKTNRKAHAGRKLNSEGFAHRTRTENRVQVLFDLSDFQECAHNFWRRFRANKLEQTNAETQKMPKDKTG